MSPADLATVLIPFGIVCFVLGYLTAIWEPQPPRSPLSRAGEPSPAHSRPGRADGRAASPAHENGRASTGPASAVRASGETQPFDYQAETARMFAGLDQLLREETR